MISLKKFQLVIIVSTLPDPPILLEERYPSRVIS
jgi:hypothetical protein